MKGHGELEIGAGGIVHNWPVLAWLFCHCCPAMTRTYYTAWTAACPGCQITHPSSLITILSLCTHHKKQSFILMGYNFLTKNQPSIICPCPVFDIAKFCCKTILTNHITHIHWLGGCSPFHTLTNIFCNGKPNISPIPIESNTSRQSSWLCKGIRAFQDTMQCNPGSRAIYGWMSGEKDATSIGVNQCNGWRSTWKLVE